VVGETTTKSESSWSIIVTWRKEKCPSTLIDSSLFVQKESIEDFLVFFSYCPGMKTIMVVIVGAGIAGLSCAFYLVKHGRSDIVVVESSDRAGGNIRSVQIGKKRIPLGALQVWEWYQDFLEMCREVDPEQWRDLKRAEWGPMYIQSSNDTYIPKNAVAAFLSLPLKEQWHAIRAIPRLVTDSDASVSELVGSEKDAPLLHRYVKTIVESYTYPSIDYLESCAVKSLLQKSGNELNVLEQMTTIVEKIVSWLKSRGVIFHFNIRVQNINDTYIDTSEGKVWFDVLVMCCPWGATHQSIAQAPITYTSFASVIVKVSGVDDTPWSAVFDTPLYNFQPLSFVNLASSPFFLENHILMYVRVDQEVKDWQRALERRWPSFLKNRQLEKVVYVHYFPYTMPLATRASQRIIEEAQGTRNVYFAGQYLGDISNVETATASGKRAAQMVLGQYIPQKQASGWTMTILILLCLLLVLIIGLIIGGILIQYQSNGDTSFIDKNRQ
jgi:NAD(P)-binding Rossmann-like domain